MRGDRHVLIVGGAGYVGSVMAPRLLAEGHSVRVLDALIYGNGTSLAGVADHERFSFVRGDVRDDSDVGAAIDGITDVIHLAALVGDPVCKRNPEMAREVNVAGAKRVFDAAGSAGVGRFLFASTCSNYGLRESDQPAAEDDELHPLSLYAETKVEMEHEVLGRGSGPDVTVLRVSTAYGMSPRMRFDLTVSEFTRQLALGRQLDVYDADTWRPYCHVDDVADAAVTVLSASPDLVAGEVFNVGGEDGNYTKRMIVEAALDALGGEGEVKWVEGGFDARNYRVSFAKIQERLGFHTRRTVPDAIARLIAAVRSGIFDGSADAGDLYGNNHFVADDAGGGEGTGGGDAG